MIRPAVAFGALILTAGPRLGAQGRDALILERGTDTIAVERFSRTSTELRSEIVIPAQGARIAFNARVSRDGSISRFDFTIRTGADTSQPPAQSAVIEFTTDSAIATVTHGSTTATQRMKSAPGAVPFLNPSFALVELVLARARAIQSAMNPKPDSVSVPGFLVQGGSTMPFGVRWIGADSAVVTIGAVPTRLAVNARSEILGGEVASQNLRIVRVRNAPEMGGRVEKPDYSAPAGAPYTAQDVSVRSPEGFTLAGTLTLPTGARRPLAAIVMITGSGLEDRDEAIPTVKGYRPFRQIADTLSRHGIAVLRLDDRGFGGSGGDPTQATSVDFANDIRAALSYLRGRPDIDPRRLGLIGHSEGGLIAPMIAASDSSLRGIVIMAGPAWTGRRIVEYQNRYAIEHADVKPERRDSLLKGAMRSVDSVAVHQPWLQYFLGYDPLPTARRVHVPVLVLQGETDQQVPSQQAPELAAGIRAGGNPDVTLHLFPNTDHLFAEDPVGSPAGYAALPVHAVRSDVLGALVTWAVAHFR